MKRSHVYVAALATVAATALAACSSSGGGGGGNTPSASSSGGSSSAGSQGSIVSSSLPTSSPSNVCETTPTAGGTLTSARQNETLSLNPGNTPGGWGDGEAIDMIFEPLIAMDPTGKTSDIVPAVADKWSVSSDGLTYSFHIRDGIEFSDGTPVTAEDVKFSLDRYADPKQTQFASFADGYKSTTIVDEQDVKVNLKEVRGGFPYALAFISGAILPEKLVKSEGEKFWDDPVGTGPWKLDSWTKGSSISFVKNPNYWQKGVPILDKVVWNFVKDDNTRVLNLKGGQAQTIDGLPWNEIASVKSDPKLGIDSYKIPSWILLAVNQKKPQFADLKVREALNDSIDRDSINQKIYSGLATIPNSFLPQLHYDGDNSTNPPFTYDLSKAKTELAQSGFASGFSATLEFPNSSPAFASLAAVLQAEWGELGIKIELRPEDQATLSKNFTGGTYDMMLPYALAASDVPIPDEFATFYGTTNSTNGFYSWFKDADIEKQVNEFTGTADDAKRAELWPKLQAAMTAKLPALNVLDLPLVKGRAANVCGDTATPIGYDTFRTTWIAG